MKIAAKALNFNKIKSFIYLLAAGLATVSVSSCVREELLLPPGECEEGLATRISFKVDVPEMSVATRADMPDGADFSVTSLWVGIFLQSTGECTYAGYHEETPGAHTPFITLKNIPTVSGLSYIVAVANPKDNFGYQYNPNSPAPNRVVRLPLMKQDGAAEYILPESTTDARIRNFNWEDYQNVAIRQLDLNDVNTPIGNLVMSGIYYDSQNDPTKASDWEEANAKAVLIPDKDATTLQGAIHLRRLISQVKFHIRTVDYTGDHAAKREAREILEVIPQSFQVKNVPYTSWLHERKAPASVGDIAAGRYAKANSGDVIRIDNAAGTNPLGYDDSKGDMVLKANYRTSPWFNGSQYLMTSEDGKGFEFDFWMMENKRWSSYDLYDNLAAGEDAYDRREKEVKTAKPYLDADGNETYTIDENTGIYTALCSSRPYIDTDIPPTVADVPETMNNCASFVEIRCRIIYTEPGLEAIRGDEDYAEVQYRSADAVYTVHLGGINQNWNDFTLRRNHKYTYNITIMDVDRIIVEARFDDEPRPGIEGVVTDVVNPPFEVDCHYAVFNIQLCNLERTGGGIIQTGEEDGPNTGSGTSGDHLINGGKYERGLFPFRIRYFDADNFARYIDQSNIDEFMSEDDKLYWTWIEFRPTTGKDVIADYKPYWDGTGEKPEFADGLTFRINEVADINKYPHTADKSKDPDDPNNPKKHDPDDRNLQWYTVFVNEYVYEKKLDEGENNFVNYVNLSPRMCWFNTLFRSSVDDESNYIRSKYVVRQQSIQTFYSIPASARKEDINAIGMEHVNETFGFNLRWDGVPTEFEGDDRTHNMQNNNGRHNTALYVYDPGHMTRGEDWVDYLNPNRLQYITGINTASNQYNVSYQLQEPPYIENENDPKREPYYVPAIYTYPYRDLQDQSGTVDPVESRSNINTTHYLRILDACMNRNRDNNGNGKIDIDEIRWYVPASSEIVDLVLGRNSLDTPLLDYDRNFYLASPGGPGNPGSATSQTEQDHQGNTRFHYATSNQRVLWVEEGATINPEADVLTGTWNLPPQNVRCVRALGTDLTTDENKDLTPAFTTDAVYTTNTDGSRTYSFYATRIYPTYYEQKNQRGYSGTALEPHQEKTGDLNRICTNGFEFSKELLPFRPVIIEVWVEGELTYPEGYYADGIQDNEHYLGKNVGGDGGAEWRDQKAEWIEVSGDQYKRWGMWFLPDTDHYGGGDRNTIPEDGYVSNGNDEQGKPGSGYLYMWWDSWSVGSTTVFQEGWYLPDVNQCYGHDESDNPGGNYQWWEAWSSGTVIFEEGYYLPDTNTPPAGFDPNNKPAGNYDWWDSWTEEGGLAIQAGWYLPDWNNYAGADKDNRPEGNYDWWDVNQAADFGLQSGQGECWWYLDLNSGPKSTQEPGTAWWDGFWDGAREYKPGGGDFQYYLPDDTTYIGSEPEPGTKEYGNWFYWEAFTRNGKTYKAGWYRPAPNTGTYYEPDMTGYLDLQGKNFFIGGTWIEPGYYKPDPNKNSNSGNCPGPGYNYFCPNGSRKSGWYRIDEGSRKDSKQNDPLRHYLGGEAAESKTYPAGWYAPKVSSRRDSNSGDSQYHHFDKIEENIKNYEAGWYLPLVSSRTTGQNGDPLRHHFNSIVDGGKTYPAGWYRVDISSATYNPSGGLYKQGPHDVNALPSGYYADGIMDEEHYLGTKVPPDPEWADKNPKWLPEKTVQTSGWEPRYVEGQYTDASGGKSNLFAYNEDSFVKDHGTTLAAANKICNETYGSGWRLPNMKEASLIKIAMDNARVYKGQVNGQYLSRGKYRDPVSGYEVGNFLACTFREYGVTGNQSRAEKNGYYTGIYYAELGEEQAGDWSGDANNSPVLGRIACITTGYNRHFYIRCVRDLRSLGD